jgi:transcription elongation GreA/GreB family factor
VRPTKRALLDELALQLRAELEAAERAQRSTQAGATHEEAKPENDKDTRALEQSYLARGQAMRVEELKLGVAEVAALAPRPFGEEATVALGALVTAEEDDARVVFFLAPRGGGNSLAGGSVRVVTPQSPLGRALVGKRVGDEAELVLAGKKRTFVLEKVE